MKRSGRISVALPAHQLEQLRGIVEDGEFRSSAAVLREALRTWLHRRNLHAGPHGAARLGRTLQALKEPPPDPLERVELLFDAADAKA